MSKIDEIQLGSNNYDVGAKAENVTYGNTNVATELARLDAKGDGVTIGMGSRNLYNAEDSNILLDGYFLNANVNTNESVGMILGGSSYINTFAIALIPVEENKEYIVYHHDGLWEYGYYAFLGGTGTTPGTITVESAIKVDGLLVQQFTTTDTTSDVWKGKPYEVVDAYRRRITTPAGCTRLVLAVTRQSGGPETLYDYRNTFFVEQGNYPSDLVEYDGNYVTKINGHPIMAADNVRELKYDIPLNTYIAGDSISCFGWGSWNTPILQKFSFKFFRNIGWGGARWGALTGATWSNIAGNLNGTDFGNASNVIARQMYRLVDGVENSGWPTPELVVIHAGTNDVTQADNGGANAYLGDADAVFDYTAQGCGANDFISTINAVQNAIDNDADVDEVPIPAQLYTMVGGLRYAIELLWSHFPYCSVLITTPLQRGYSASIVSYLRYARQQIIKACAELGVPVLDFYAVSGIYSPMCGNFLVRNNDFVHPYLKTGGRRLADILGRYLVTHYGGGKDWFALDNSGNTTS